MKKNKVIWTIKLADFENSDYVCMLIRPKSSQKGNEYVVFAIAYKGEQEIGRKMVDFSSGVLTTIRESK